MSKPFQTYDLGNWGSKHPKFRLFFSGWKKGDMSHRCKMIVSFRPGYSGDPLRIHLHHSSWFVGNRWEPDFVATTHKNEKTIWLVNHSRIWLILVFLVSVFRDLFPTFRPYDDVRLVSDGLKIIYHIWFLDGWHFSTYLPWDLESTHLLSFGFCHVASLHISHSFQFPEIISSLSWLGVCLQICC